MLFCGATGHESDKQAEICPEPIFLNVYDLPAAQLNSLQYAVTQTGLYHAGVEVFGKEWSFGGCAEGIYTVKPRRWNDLKPCQTLAMGTTTLTRREFAALIKRMKFKWLGSEYHLLSKNCCSFSRVLLQELGAQEMPGWVDRAAREGTTKVTSAVTQAVCHIPHALVRGTGVGIAAFGGELVAGQAGGLVGEAVAGDAGKTVGHELGKLGGAVGAGAAVGALGGPGGMAVGAGIGAASYAVGKACDGVATLIDPNKVVMPGREYSQQFNRDAAAMNFFYLECELEDNRQGDCCVLAVAGNKDEPGTACICYAKKAERGQKWRLTEDGYLQSMYGDLFLAVAQNNAGQGAEVVIWAKKPSELGQRWRLDRDGGLGLKNGHGTFLTVSQSGGQGCKTFTWGKTGEAGQRWRLSAT